MSIWKWFDTTDVDALADGIAAEISKRYPPEGVSARTKKKASEHFARVHESVFARVETFGRTHSLNIYQRARLGNRVKWALRDAGYAGEFVETLTHELMTFIVVIGKRKATAKQ